MSMDWLTEVFAPTVKKYPQNENLPLKCLLLMDNTPVHPPGLEGNLDIKYVFIKVKFLALNMTPPMQLMNLQVILNFKKL